MPQVATGLQPPSQRRWVQAIVPQYKICGGIYYVAVILAETQAQMALSHSFPPSLIYLFMTAHMAKTSKQCLAFPKYYSKMQ